MRIHHLIFIGLSLILIFIGLSTVYNSIISEEVVFIEAENITVGDVTFVDDREIYDYSQHVYLVSEENDNAQSAVLIFHGFLATPQEVSGLAEYLHDEGYTVLAPLMAGHGSDPNDLENVSFEDWQDEAFMYYEALDLIYDEVHVIGFSLGSLSALTISEEYDVTGKVVTIGPPFYIVDETLDNINLTLVLEEVSEYVPTVGKLGKVSDDIVGRETYEEFPLSSVLEIIEYSEIVEESLPIISEDMLLIHGTFDFVADPEGSEYLYESISSENKELVKINSLHPLLMGIHKEEVFEIIFEFLLED